MKELEIIQYETDQDGVKLFLSGDNYINIPWAYISGFKFL